MTTSEIFTAIKRRESNGRAVLYPVWEALVYTLYKEGYVRRYIADALHVHPDSISYAVSLCMEHLDANDENVKNASKALGEHDLTLKPYFEMTGKGGTSRVRTELFIDGIKY